MDTVLGLNSKQLKAFNRLVKTYKECEKLGVMFVNMYGTIEAYNKEFVAKYGDVNTIDEKEQLDALHTNHGYSAENYFRSVDSWADDNHLIVLTEKGKELLKKQK